MLRKKITIGLLILIVIVLFKMKQEPEGIMVPSKDFVVPNIVHFIRFGSSPLTFIDAVCILAALKNQRPEKLIIHSDQKDFKGGKYWKVVTSHRWAEGVVEVHYLPMPEQIFGKPFGAKFKLHHASDVDRLRILIKHGGIYLDNDSYIVRSLDPLRKYEMTLGWEVGGGISNQVIIASQKARFLRIWLDSFRDYDGNRWYYNGGEKPTKILEEHPYLVNRMKYLLAEYKYIPYILYLQNSKGWTTHYAIHLLINHQYMLEQNLSTSATYPVVFNETNILNYNATIKNMALSVYPFEKS